MTKNSEEITKAIAEIANGITYAVENLEVLTERLEQEETNRENLYKSLDLVARQTGCKHGWYSVENERMFGVAEYKNVNGFLVSVSRVSESYKSGAELYQWKDKVYVGLVKEFVKNVWKHGLMWDLPLTTEKMTAYCMNWPVCY